MSNSTNLIVYLNTIKDPRRKEGQRHALVHVLLIVIMSICNGSLGYRDMQRFMTNNKKELLKIFKPKLGTLPSFDTLRKVLINIDFEELSEVFYKWSKEYVRIEKGEIMSVDGKALGGTLTDKNTPLQSFSSLVSVFASKRGQVIANSLVKDSKSSEITVVRKMIELLDLKDCLLTLDALHCQKKTVACIIKSKNNYVIGVKTNQKKLHNQIQTNFKSSKGKKKLITQKKKIKGERK